MKQLGSALKRIAELDFKGVSKKRVLTAIMGVVAVALLLMSYTGDEKECEGNTEAELTSEEYINEQEERLEKILGKIDGAGEVEVMLTLESCYENVYLKESASKIEGENENQKSQSEEKYITVKNGSEGEAGVIIKVYEPVIKGVAVVAEGGGSSKVKMAIQETVSAVFNISSANISVEKMTTKGVEQ